MLNINDVKPILPTPTLSTKYRLNGVKVFYIHIIYKAKYKNITLTQSWPHYKRSLKDVIPFIFLAYIIIKKVTFEKNFLI